MGLFNLDTIKECNTIPDVSYELPFDIMEECFKFNAYNASQCALLEEELPVPYKNYYDTTKSKLGGDDEDDNSSNSTKSNRFKEKLDKFKKKLKIWFDKIKDFLIKMFKRIKGFVISKINLILDIIKGNLRDRTRSMYNDERYGNSRYKRDKEYEDYYRKEKEAEDAEKENSKKKSSGASGAAYGDVGFINDNDGTITVYDVNDILKKADIIKDTSAKISEKIYLNIYLSNNISLEEIKKGNKILDKISNIETQFSVLNDQDISKLNSIKDNCNTVDIELSNVSSYRKKFLKLANTIDNIKNKLDIFNKALDEDMNKSIAYLDQLHKSLLKDQDENIIKIANECLNATQKISKSFVNTRSKEVTEVLKPLSYIHRFIANNMTAFRKAK